MSDIESSTDASSVSSFGDISVCNEIGQLIENCQQLHDHIHTSFETLKNIHSLVENNNIIVSYDEWTGDFNELLEKIHTESLENIKNNGQINFGELLLERLDNIIFN
jgi:hypothetical protein